MAARYALVEFFFVNTVSGNTEFIYRGAQRDSLLSQAVLETPASYWSATPLVPGNQISAALAAYLVQYPNT